MEILDLRVFVYVMYKEAHMHHDWSRAIKIEKKNIAKWYLIPKPKIKILKAYLLCL